MTSDEMIRRLQAQYGNIGDIEKDPGTTDEYAPTRYGYTANNFTLPGQSSPGMMVMGNNPTYNSLDGITGDSSEFIAPLSNEPWNGTPGSWLGKFDQSGNMIGDPYFQEEKEDWILDHLEEISAAALIAAGGWAFAPELSGLFGAGGAGAGGAGAGGAGALGAADLAAASGMAGLEGAGALGIADLATASGMAGLEGAGALGAADLATASGMAGLEGAGALGTADLATASGMAGLESTPWYEPFTQGLQTLKDVTDVGKYFTEAPAGVQKAITSGVRNIGGQLLTTGDVDFGDVFKSGLTGGFTDFINPYFSELPKELQSIAKAGVQTALQGGDLESVLKSTAFGAITGNVTQAITGATGSKWAGELASNAIKQALTSGNIDPRNLTASALAQLAGRAVGAETGNEALGRAATTAVLGAIKGKDLEDIAKQLAMGALTTPTKKG